MPLEIDASRSGFPPAGTIFTSFSGSIPRRRHDSRNPISEMLPKRLTDPILPRNCSVVVMLAVLTIWSIKVGMIDKIITVSAPPRRGFTTLGAEVTTMSRSPATSACIAGGPALKKIDSTDRPCFVKNPFSCATHSGVCDAVIAAQPTRARSCAAGLSGSTRFAFKTTKVSKQIFSINLTPIAVRKMNPPGGPTLFRNGVTVGISRRLADCRMHRPPAQDSLSFHPRFLHDSSRSSIVDITNGPNPVNLLLLQCPVYDFFDNLRHVTFAPVRTGQRIA